MPSFQSIWSNNQKDQARIKVLEVTHRDKPDEPPIAWVLVERVEEITRNPNNQDEVWAANIRLHCELALPRHSRVTAKSCEFDGYYSKGYNMVSITSRSFQRGMVALDLEGLKGQRIGTYLMNEVVKWAQQWPDATVQSIKLLDGQAEVENRARRNRFYEQFGIAFAYADDEHRVGESLPMKVDALISVDTWGKNIKEVNVQVYLADILERQENLSLELAASKRMILSLREDLKSAKMRRMPSWWTRCPCLVLMTVVIGSCVWIIKY